MTTHELGCGPVTAHANSTLVVPCTATLRNCQPSLTLMRTIVRQSPCIMNDKTYIPKAIRQEAYWQI